MVAHAVVWQLLGHVLCGNSPSVFNLVKEIVSLSCAMKRGSSEHGDCRYFHFRCRASRDCKDDNTGKKF